MRTDTALRGLATIGARLLVGELEHAEPVRGGDLSQILHVTLADGREAIVKGGPAPRTEAAMLDALAASAVPAPAVLAVSDDALVLEVLPRSGRMHGAWANLGAVLAKLHACTGPRYGWPEGYAFGAVAIDNDWTDDWPTFWAERRLLVHGHHIPADLVRRVERLARDLPNRLPVHPPPALLHGDLWGGNVLVEADRVSGLVDPACYYGHGEVDIGMLTLFDRPDAAFYRAYGGAYGGADAGLEDRLIVYRLWPTLVHLRLFGSSYRSMVEGLLTAAGV